MTSATQPRTGQANGHAKSDERYKAIDRTMKRFDYERDALLEVLNAAQQSFGFLSEELLLYIAHELQVPMSKVYGVATFYHMFTFDPLGEHNCIICTGTACHVKGSLQIVRALAEAFNVKAGGTTEDGLFSLTTARCLGSCGLAPVVVLDGEVHGKENPDAVLREVKEILAFAKEHKEVENG